MKRESPPAARCPVPAKQKPKPPEPRAMWSNENDLADLYKEANRTCLSNQEWLDNDFRVALIPLRRRPSKAQLRAVQRWLNDEDAMIAAIARKADRLCTQRYAGTYLQHSEGITATLDAIRALGLISKPGQHAGEKGKR